MGSLRRRRKEEGALQERRIQLFTVPLKKRRNQTSILLTSPPPDQTESSKILERRTRAERVQTATPQGATSLHSVSEVSHRKLKISQEGARGLHGTRSG